MKQIRRTGLESQFTYDPVDFRFIRRVRGDETVRLSLGNAKSEYCKAPDDEARAGVIGNYVGVWTTIETPVPGSIPESLLPAVRGRAYLELTKLQELLDGDGPPEQKYLMTLGSDIAVTIARDSEQTVGLLAESSYDEIGIPKDEAMEIAIENLRKMSADNWIEVGPSLFKSGWHDYYDPARLLLPDVIRRLPIRGNAVAFAVDNDTLFVTGSENRQGLLAMSERARKAIDTATRRISGQAITLVDGRWVDYLPTDPELHPFIDLQKETRYADYAQQAELLRRLYEKRGDDVFVAIYDLFRKSGEAELTSFSTWAGGIVSLLPRADVIGFVEDEQAQPFIVPWAAAERIVGHLMVETGDYPPRYRVEEFPAKAEIAKLKEFAL